MTKHDAKPDVRRQRQRRFALPLVAGAFAMVVAACEPEGRADPRGAPAAAPAPAPPDRYDLGSVASVAEIAAVDIDVNPDGVGLPRGSGTPAGGASVYARYCAACHGASGQGLGTNPPLVGRAPRDSFPFGRDAKLVKTVGNYWPYATTLFDYVRRAMPPNTPGSLTSDELYNVVAFVLARNDIIPPDAVLDSTTLPRVRMPARDRFVRDDRRGGAEFR